jgi:predicted alpha-1,6-mannanase (GH76 family)
MECNGLRPKVPRWELASAVLLGAMVLSCAGTLKPAAMPGVLSPADPERGGNLPQAPQTTADAPSRAEAAQQRAAAAQARQRADTALAALVSGYWNGSTFTATRERADPAPYWLNSQALDALLDGVERTGGRWADVARAFLAGQSARGWRSDYFDDENWMALALLRASDVLGDPALVSTAEALLDDVISQATDETCCGSTPGGLWWDRSHTQKATASNAGPVITAARLYERTGEARLLEFARRAFAYWLTAMVDPVTGRVADHENADGEKVWWLFTYNEGTMIGAALALHHATGDASYLALARKIGGSLLDHETGQSRAGRILTDGPSCGGDCQQFKGIAQRYLAELAESDPGGPWGALVARDGAAVWTLARDARTDGFGVDWAGPPGAATLASQISAAMALDAAARAGTHASLTHLAERARVTRQ